MIFHTVLPINVGELVFRRCHHRQEREVAASLTDELCVVYRRHGLSEGEFDVLTTLRRAGAPYQRAPGELAQFTMVTTGAMAKRVDSLEKAGLVDRQRSGADERGRAAPRLGSA